MPPIPTGTVTFLFTDIEGSTQLWESAPDAMRSALERHDALMREAIDAHGGYVFSTGGDGFAVAFARADDALEASVAMQEALSAEPWPAGAKLRVRMGLHTGEASERDGDYFGPSLNRAARLMAVAHGGQVVCTNATAALAGEGAVLRDLGDHRLRDLAAPAHVFQVGPGTFPALRTVDTVPTNLPTVRTDLIGRTDDVATLMGLTEHERLVTLTGTGGVGKTRLALGVAGALAAGFADGCWLVELAPVSDGDEVSKAMAAAMRAPTTNPEALVDYLADRRMLIVLDNCEHVLDSVADLADAILETAPDVHLIATSREPLGLDGEQVRRVQSLAVPAPDAEASVAIASPAVRLFAERAAAVSQGFDLDAANAAAVVEICRHLDGIPLAIELAAARVRAMSPPEIARRLDERFRLLAGGSRRSQERHRTLLATVAWSHDLLNEEEKVVFRRLSVFPATFDLDAAAAVTGGNDDEVDVVDCVLRLVDRSLVVYEDGPNRYRLLETLRQFGADRLADAGEAEDTRARHAGYFLAVVDRIAPSFHDARYPVARAIAVLEADNVRGTADWCIETGRWADLAVMVRQLWYFLIQDSPGDGSAWYRILIENAESLDDQVVVDLLADFAWVQVSSLANFAPATELAERSHALAARCGVRPSAEAWNALSMASLYSGQIADALRFSDDGFRLADGRGEVDAAVTALCARMSLLGIMGDEEAGAAAAAEALRRAEASGHPVLVCAAVMSMCAVFLTARSDPDFAASMAVIDRHKGSLVTESGGLNDAWRDVLWGMARLGLAQPDAVARLAQGARVADRMNVGHALELAIRLLAVAAAEAGRTRDAVKLLAFAEDHLRAYRIESPGQTWIQARLDLALDGTPEREHEVPMHRREIMALVASLADDLSPEGS